MRRTLIAATCMLALALAGQANADIINGQYVPNGLNVGDTYRLIFVTSGSIDATSGVALDYDNFAIAQANAPNSLLGGGFDYGWQAVMSTYDGRLAKDIINPAGPSSPGIYNTHGDQVALNGASMLGTLPGDVHLLAPVSYDQHGTSVGDVVGDAFAWTGSMSTGEAYILAPSYDFRVGAPVSPFSGLSYTEIGDPKSVSGSWLQRTAVPDITGYDPFSTSGSVASVARVYAMSRELTAVPEPATLVMWSLFAGVAGLVFWRKGRKAS